MATTYTPSDDMQSMASVHIGKFRGWLGKTNKGFIGEISVPNDRITAEQAQWNALLDFSYSRMLADNISSTAWASGHHWADGYRLSFFETNGTAGTTWTDEDNAPPLLAHVNDAVDFVGINYAGHEFFNGSTPPAQSDFNYHVGKGLKTIRYPLSPAYLYPTSGGSIDATNLNHVRDMLNRANAAGAKIILDVLHPGDGADYVKMFGITLDNPAAMADYKDYVKKLLNSSITGPSGTTILLKYHPALWAIDIVNEPAHVTYSVWETLSQDIYSWLRTTIGWSGVIMIPLAHYSGVHSINTYHPSGPWIVPESGDTNFYYQAHFYPNLIGTNGQYDATFSKADGTAASYDENLALAGEWAGQGTFTEGAVTGVGEVTYIRQAHLDTSYVNTLTIPIDTTGGNALIVAVSSRQATDVSGITFNGLALTKQIESVNFNVCGSQIWTLLNPPEGLYDIVLTSIEFRLFSVTGIVYSGVDSVRTGNGLFSISADVAVPISSSIGDFIVGALNYKLATTVTSASDQTNRQNSQNPDPDMGQHVVDDKVAAVNSESVNWTGVSDNWAATAIALQPVSTDTPPTEPTNVTVGSVSSTSAFVSWDASTDDVGVDSYDIDLNGNIVKTVTSSPTTLSNLSPSTEYVVGITARDTAGNTSTRATATFTTDEAPAISTESVATVEAPKIIRHRQLYFKIEKLNATENVVETKDVTIHNGNVDVGAGGSRRKCSFELLEALPVDWQMHKFKLYYGYKTLSTDPITYHPLGVFIPINPAEREKLDKLVTSFQGVDKKKLFSDYQLDKPILFASGTTVRSIVQDVAGWFNETKLILEDNLGTLGADFTFEEGSTAEQLLNALITSFSAEWFYNPDGFLVVRKRIPAQSRAIKLAIDDKDQPYYLDSERSIDDDNYYNKVTLVGGKIDTPIYRATFSDTDAIAKAGGRVVQRYFTHDAAVTQAQVDGLAQYYLSNGVLLPSNLRMTSLVIPDLEVDDIISKEGTRYEVRSFNVPLGLGTQSIKAGEIL